MKKTLLTALMIFLLVGISWADTAWEHAGDFYFLSKNTRESFSAIGPGANRFAGKYLSYDGVDFLVRGNNAWNDYGRLNLEGNNLFSMPIQAGARVEELHFLAGGSYSNSYKNDPLLSLYGDNYYYAVITVIFAYQDGAYRAVSAPIFWDWFHLGKREWSKDGAMIKSLGDNPARPGCNFYHVIFVNPRPSEPVRDILVSDSWLSGTPFSDIFAVTLKSKDTLKAVSRTDK